MGFTVPTSDYDPIKSKCDGYYTGVNIDEEGCLDKTLSNGGTITQSYPVAWSFSADTIDRCHP